MGGLEKINTDFAALFREGYALLEEGCSAVMNGYRKEAFEKFVQLGGIPYKTEDYIYTNLLPVFERDYHVVLKYIRQDVGFERGFPLFGDRFGDRSNPDGEWLVV